MENILPIALFSLIYSFRGCFDKQSTFDNAIILFIGCLLTIGDHTVSNFIRASGKLASKHYSSYHGFLSRSHYSQISLTRQLLQLIDSFIPPGVIQLAVDESLVRRWGPMVYGKGMHRDPVLSSQNVNINQPGHKWVILSVLFDLPFSKQVFALPFLCILYYPEEAAKRNDASVNKRMREKRPKHRTPIQIVTFMIRWVERWLPHRQFHLLGDGGYSAQNLAYELSEDNQFRSPRTRLITRLPLDAAIYQRPEKSTTPKVGRPRVKGERLLSPQQNADDPNAQWTTIDVKWYAGKIVKRKIIINEGLWYRSGRPPVWIKWVFSRDPEGQRKDECFMTTDIALSGKEILEKYVTRWPAETMHQQIREHLGLETQKNWCENSIERCIPLLCGVYTLIILWGAKVKETLKEKGSVKAAPWYDRKDLCFGDILAHLRNEVLTHEGFQTAWVGEPVDKNPMAHIQFLIHRLAYG